jgi:predicted patatin/cPLA2 family phospholipase
MDLTKKRIHFILPGGGVNGAFQAGFLYRLFKDCYDKIIIDRIDGISVGALNGLAIILEDIEFIKSIWYYIEDRDTIFNSHNTNSEIWYKGSIYDSLGLRNLIYLHKDFIKNEEIEKYNCVVHNCNTQSYEYINGTRTNLLEFIIASASPPLISPYLKIDDIFYADGCIDQIYPIDYVTKNDVRTANEEYNTDVSNSPNKINIVVGYYDSNDYYLFNIYKTFKKNIYNNNTDIKKLIDNNDIITINNPCFYNLIDFSRENIDNGFKLGEEVAIEFYNKHILKLE